MLGCFRGPVNSGQMPTRTLYRGLSLISRKLLTPCLAHFIQPVTRTLVTSYRSCLIDAMFSRPIAAHLEKQMTGIEGIDFIQMLTDGETRLSRDQQEPFPDRG
jgi:hypothetical protein